MTNTQFKPGQSGNPKGRPKDKTPATLLRKSIADDMPEIVRKMIESAKEGDVAAAKVLLDRVCPPLKPQALPVSMPVHEDAIAQSAEIIKAVLMGAVPADIANQLLSALLAQAKLTEMDRQRQQQETDSNTRDQAETDFWKRISGKIIDVSDDDDSMA